MAKFYPDYLDSDVPQSERVLWESFQKLDVHWRVFHSVAWQSKRDGRQGDGEADFVLLHPQKGAIVLEVKGGGVDLRNGTWITIDRFGKEHSIRNPFEQAKDSKYALVAYLQSLSPPILGCRVEHAVAFPDLTVDDRFGTYGPMSITLDRKDLQDPAAAVDRVTKHWGMKSTLASESTARIVELLAPTVRIRRRLLDDVAESHEQIERLTAEQLRALAVLRRARRAVVSGGAGTGKTVLAMERARTLAAEGFDTALLCYNAPLEYWIERQMVGTGVYVGTFHALCVQQARAAGISIPVDPSDEWWNDAAPTVLLDAVDKTRLRFDAIVIDEGQDFSKDWLEAIEALLRSSDSSPLNVFVDQRQELYARSFEMPGWPIQSLTLNCRNTIPIAAKVSRVFGEDPPVIGASGPDPVFVTTRLDREGRKVVQSLVTRLLENESLDASQIAVLSDSWPFLESLRSLIVADGSFTPIGGTGVVADTIARFKGLEADAVVLCLSDALLAYPAAKSIAYVGFSRPRSVLYVLGSQKIRNFLGWN